MVSVDGLKKQFKDLKYDKIGELSNDDVSRIIESLVFKMMKGFKHGRILDNPEMKDAADELDKFTESAKYKFNNLAAVVNNRKFCYVLDAYLTANTVVTNGLFRELNAVKVGLNSNLASNIHVLELLLEIYYFNYSNSGMLQELMFNLSAADDVPLTFEIHDKYTYGDEFGVNHHLMKDLDYNIKVIVDVILELLDHMDKIHGETADVNVEKEINAEIDAVKESLKDVYANADDFKTIALSESGYNDAIIDSIAVDKTNLSANNRYVELKNKFYELYNGNAFKQFSELSFEWYKERNGDDADFKEFMKKEPAYDLKECKFIKPEISGIEFRNN